MSEMVEMTIRRCKSGGFAILGFNAETLDPAADLSCSTLSEALSFIRSKMGPEGEGTNLQDPFLMGKRQPSPEELYAKLQRAQSEEAAARAAALDDLQRLGQEADAEPAWKRAKAGDHIRVKGREKAFRVIRVDGPEFHRIGVHSCQWPAEFIWNENVVEILPTPPRHGDFGSLGE